MLIIGANVSPEKSRAYAARDNAEAMCDKMMSDAALGTERRMTREMCDKLKAEMDRRVREAGSTSYQVSTSSVALPLSPEDQKRAACANNIEAAKLEYQRHMKKGDYRTAAESMRECAKLLQDPYLDNLVSTAEGRAKRGK